jgi:hypothetical protein
MLPQAPEFDHFCDRVPSDSSTPAAPWVPACLTDLGPWAEGPRDGVICSEGSMKANWVTASFAGKARDSALTIILACDCRDFEVEQARGVAAEDRPALDIVEPWCAFDHTDRIDLAHVGRVIGAH